MEPESLDNMKTFWHGVFDRYVTRRLHPGSGLYSVLTGSPEVGCLDSDNRRYLADLLLFVEKHVPAEARGSRENVERWLGGAN